MELILGFEPGTSSLPKAHIKALNAFERSECIERLRKRRDVNVRECAYLMKQPSNGRCDRFVAAAFFFCRLTRAAQALVHTVSRLFRMIVGTFPERTRMAETQQYQGIAGICRTFPPFSDDSCCADVGRTDLGTNLLAGA